MIKQETKFGLVYIPEYTSEIYYNKEVYNMIIEWLIKIYEVSLCYKTDDVKHGKISYMFLEKLLKNTNH